MHRLLIDVPALGLRVHSFSAALGLACLAALWVTAWRARRVGIDEESVYGLAVWLMSGGFIGARVLYLVAHPEAVQEPLDVLKVWQGGIVFYGCILGGLIGSVAYWYRHPFPFRAMADVVAPALAVGSGVGRVGCFLNGCCYGGASDLPWAVSFPAGSLPWARHVHAGLIPPGAGWSLAVHPTQLYSVLDGLILLGLLSAFFPRRRRDGEVMALLMVTYPVTRFLVEALRDDEPGLTLGLTMSQWISVATFAAGCVFWLHLWSLPASKDEADAASALPYRHHRAGTSGRSVVPAGSALDPAGRRA